MNIKGGKDIIWVSLVLELLFSSVGECAQVWQQLPGSAGFSLYQQMAAHFWH